MFRVSASDQVIRDYACPCPSLVLTSGREYSTTFETVFSFSATCACGFEVRSDIAAHDAISSEVPWEIAVSRIIRHLLEEATAWHRPPLAKLVDWGWFDAEASA